MHATGRRSWADVVAGSGARGSCSPFPGPFVYEPRVFGEEAPAPVGRCCAARSAEGLPRLFEDELDHAVASVAREVVARAVDCVIEGGGHAALVHAPDGCLDLLPRGVGA
jgi:hypothetical protein